MIFEQIATGGRQSYIVGCPDTHVTALIDPEIRQIDHHLALAAKDGARMHYAIDTSVSMRLAMEDRAALDGGMKGWREGGFPLEAG